MDLQHPLSSVIPGATGKILETLARVTADLNLSTVARLAGVSPAQASRVLPRLVELGLVIRRDTPPSSQFALNRDHIQAKAVEVLARTPEALAEAIRDLVPSVRPSPSNVTLFGSAARGSATADSDIDLLVVRPQGVEDDDAWDESIWEWSERIQLATGNRVSVLQVDEDELTARLSADSAIWQDIPREGITVLGKELSVFGAKA